MTTTPPPATDLTNALEELRASVAGRGARWGLAGSLQAAILRFLETLLKMVLAFRDGRLAPLPCAAATPSGMQRAGSGGSKPADAQRAVVRAPRVDFGPGSGPGQALHRTDEEDEAVRATSSALAETRLRGDPRTDERAESRGPGMRPACAVRSRATPPCRAPPGRGRCWRSSARIRRMRASLLFRYRNINLRCQKSKPRMAGLRRP